MQLPILALLILCLRGTQSKFQSNPKHQHLHSHHHNKDKESKNIEKDEPKASTSTKPSTTGPTTTSIVWAYGMELGELCVAPGTSVTFSWSGSGHNVVEVADRQELEDCTGFSGQDIAPTSGPHVWQASSIPGRHFFVCGVGSHCSRGGMKAVVRVSHSCGGTEKGLNIDNDLDIDNDQNIVKPEASTTRTRTTSSSPTTSIRWAYGMNLAERCVAPGTTVTFSWSGGHNVVEVASRKELTDCTGFSGQDLVPSSGPHVWQASSIPGRHFFVCGVGSHCSRGGMKAVVRVSNTCGEEEL